MLQESGERQRYTYKVANTNCIFSRTQPVFEINYLRIGKNYVIHVYKSAEMILL